MVENNNKKVRYSEYLLELKELEKQLEKITCIKGLQDRILFVNIGNKNNVEIGINLASSGSISSLEAKRWGEHIKDASDLAKKFKYNGYSIDYK